jgi:DHA1 family bicyclomycin/chloramphenicol resistance-like MFS transporter
MHAATDGWLGMHDSTELSAAAVPRRRAAFDGYIVFFGALVALGPLSIDSYLPAMPAMAADFGVDLVRLNHTLSLFLLGYGFGQLFGGAFSDQIGRRRVGLIGLGVYVVASLAIALAATVEQVQWLRLVQALGAGFSTVISLAAVRDIYPTEQLGKRFASLTLIMLIAPLLAPALGAFLLRFGWPSIFLVKAVLAVVLIGLYAFVIPETHVGHWRHFSMSSVFRQCREVVTRRVDGRRLPMRYGLAMALCAHVLMIFLTNASFLYIEHFGVTPQRFPLFFGMSVIGLMAMNIFSMRRLERRNADRFFRRGLAVQLAAVLTLLGIVIAGFDTLWTVVPCLVAAISMLGIVSPAGSARYMSFFHQLAGSASSVYTTTLFMGGALLGAASSFLFDGSLLPMASVMAAASLAANLIARGLPNSQAADVVARERENS